MKPGDHPEFFRLPPPLGTSRESTIQLAKDGRFFHDGEPVEKKAMADAMHRWLAVHPDDGRFILTNGYDWTYLAVEDTPAFVTAVRGEPPNPPTLVLADGSHEVLDPTTLVEDDEGACFATVMGGRLAARFLRHAQTDLAPWLSEGEPVAISVAGRAYPIGRRGASTPPKDRAQ